MEKHEDRIEHTNQPTSQQQQTNKWTNGQTNALSHECWDSIFRIWRITSIRNSINDGAIFYIGLSWSLCRIIATCNSVHPLRAFLYNCLDIFFIFSQFGARILFCMVNMCDRESQFYIYALKLRANISKRLAFYLTSNTSASNILYSVLSAKYKAQRKLQTDIFHMIGLGMI